MNDREIETLVLKDYESTTIIRPSGAHEFVRIVEVKLNHLPLLKTANPPCPSLAVVLIILDLEMMTSMESFSTYIVPPS
jgi:hypothetical protein